MDNGSMLYVGETQNGTPNGEGKLYYSGMLSLVYEGGFKNGKFHGYGTRVNDDRTTSRGRFEEGRFLG